MKKQAQAQAAANQKQDWQAELIQAEQAREAANQQAAARAAEQAASRQAAAAAEQAAAAFQAAASEYQMQAAADIEKAREKAARGLDKKNAANLGALSPYGHRKGSEGALMDNILAAYHKQAPAAAMPSPEAFLAYAKQANIPCPYAISRIRGHLNHLQSKHGGLLPESLRRK